GTVSQVGVWQFLRDNKPDRSVFAVLTPNRTAVLGQGEVDVVLGGPGGGIQPFGLTQTNPHPPCTCQRATASSISGGSESRFLSAIRDIWRVGIPNFRAIFGPRTGLWNGFFLNDNGNITLGAGGTSQNPTITGFRSGLPRIEAAWADLNP